MRFLIALLLCLALTWVIRALLHARADRLRPTVFEPRPPEIIAALQAAPLMEQTRAARAYRGLKVRWHVALEEIIPNGLALDLMLQDPASLRPGVPFAWVLCSVRRGRYPQINGLAKHAPLWITGVIVQVKGEQITLRNAALDFDGENVLG